MSRLSITGAVLCALAAPITAAIPSARADEIAAQSVVTGATLYPAAATVRRAITFSAPAGRHEVMIADMPIGLSANSLRVEGADDAAYTILSFDHRIDRPALEPLTNEARATLIAQIRDLEWEQRALADLRQTAIARLDYMAAFREATLRAPTGESKGDGLLGAVGAWTKAWAEMSKEIDAAHRTQRDADRKMQDLAEKLAGLRRELDRSGSPPPPRNVVSIVIETEQPIENGVLTISYLTPQASWSPLYDLRLQGAGSGAEPRQRRMQLVRRAEIRQNTGEDWENASLILSTARPSGRVGALEPAIRQARIVEPVAEREEDPVAEEAADEQEYLGNVLDAQAAPAAPAPEPAPVSALEASALARYVGATVTFEIKDPARAPGDGSARRVLIGEETALVRMMIRATPAIEEVAYLYAAFWNGETPLPPGSAALYREGAFLGQTELEYLAPGDRTALAFGRFEQIAVTRRIRNRTQGEEGLFTTSNREQARFQLTARNLSDETQKVTLFDSMPYTETRKIEIEFVGVEPPTEQDVDGRRGAMAWTFDLEPGAENVIDFGYDFSWPEGQRIELR